jgi:hypothetical protein
LIFVLELLLAKACDDHRKRLCFDIRQVMISVTSAISPPVLPD